MLTDGGNSELSNVARNYYYQSRNSRARYQDVYGEVDQFEIRVSCPFVHERQMEDLNGLS